MNTYIVRGENGTLEELAEEGTIRIIYRARHRPITALSTALELEELEKKLPGYDIQDPKTYETTDDTK